MRRRSGLLLLALVVALALGNTASASTPAGAPTASSGTVNPLVGPLFQGSVTTAHSCTASVLAAPQHDLILTAAHCVSGTGAGLSFAPGYDGGATPYGIWTTTEAYVDPSWSATQDPQHDYAILRVAPKQFGSQTMGLSDFVGGFSYIAAAPRAGARMTVPAYLAGIDDEPIDCTVSVYYSDGYPSFDCDGYVGGTSGSPWLLHQGGVWLVSGVIGGLDQGGCADYTSYSSAFGSDIFDLWVRAAENQPGDTLPVAGSDGC